MATVEPGNNNHNIAIGGLVLTSVMLLAFLFQWESSGKWVLTAYADKLAGGLPTVCNGLTRHVTTTPIIVGDVWTVEQCEREERAALEKVQRRLLKCFKQEPPQSVFDAASSHAWNFGESATCGSAAMKAWQRSDWRLGCQRLYMTDAGRPVWSYVKTGKTLPNGKPGYRFVPGLQNRRRGEYALCMGDVA